MGAADNAIPKIRSGWSRFRDLASLLVSRGLPLVGKGRLYDTCLRSVMLHGSET